MRWASTASPKTRFGGVRRRRHACRGRHSLVPFRQFAAAGRVAADPIPRRPQPQFPRPTQGDERVNAERLREMTDDSGGRTEIIREARDLESRRPPSIADELSQQYFIGYPAGGKRDGRWHVIRVEVPDRSYRVRARRGYVAN